MPLLPYRGTLFASTPPPPSLSSALLTQRIIAWTSQTRQIRQQALIALEEAAVVIMVVDGQAGCNVLDEEIARFLRQQKVPVFLAVNKCESQVPYPLVGFYLRRRLVV